MRRIIGSAAVFAALLAPRASADLQESLIVANGTAYGDTFAVPGLNAAGFNSGTGLGSLTWTFNPGVAGSYSLGIYFDHELGVPFYDEYGSVSGVPAGGVSWQIDEPGWGDANRVGTIYGNTLSNALDNTNSVPGTLSNFLLDCGANTAGNPVNGACNNDVSMAMGFNFLLAADEHAVIGLTVSPNRPAGGFYLRQHADAGDPNQDIYFTGSIAIVPNNQVVPEPGSIVLLGSVAAALVLLRRRMRRA